MTGLRKYKPLRLMAADAADLQLISACLQDAVAKLGDFAYLAQERRFALVVNRFLWECTSDDAGGPYGRVRTALHFDDVKSAKFQHLRQGAKEAVVELLAVRFDAEEDGMGAVTLEFAGGGAVRLEVESVNAYLSDISDPWLTRLRPAHEA